MHEKKICIRVTLDTLIWVYGINNYETSCSLHKHTPTFGMCVQNATTNSNLQFVCTHVKNWLQLMLCLFDWKLGWPGHCILECSDHTHLLEVSNSESKNIYLWLMNILWLQSKDTCSSKWAFTFMFIYFSCLWIVLDTNSIMIAKSSSKIIWFQSSFHHWLVPFFDPFFTFWVGSKICEFLQLWSI